MFYDIDDPNKFVKEIKSSLKKTEYGFLNFHIY